MWIVDGGCRGQGISSNIERYFGRCLSNKGGDEQAGLHYELVEMCKRAGLSVFWLVEAARCELYVEARMMRLSSASVKGVSAVSGRERVMKKALIKESNLWAKKRKRKAGTVSEEMVMAEEARRTGDWRLAMTVSICFYGRHRRYFQMELVLKEYLRVVKVCGTQALFQNNLRSGLKRMLS